MSEKYCERVFKLRKVSCSSEDRSLCETSREVSSAKIVRRLLEMLSEISLIYIKKRIGPRMEPCGTPYETGFNSGGKKKIVEVRNCLLLLLWFFDVYEKGRN